MKNYFLFTGMLLWGAIAQAQDVLYAKDILPASPEAAAFAKNVNIPVSYTSGTPQISVPIYSVKSGMLEVPVSLSYNASGIRVEEVPTWVGLGWSLSAGGQITRSVRGDPDETPSYGYMNVPYYRKVKYVDTAHCRCMGGTGQTWAIEQELNTYHQLDLEPDQFSFSLMGYSGDFYYNQDSARFILVPYQNILIEGSPGSFTLTLPNGVKGHFGGCDSCGEVLLSGTTTSYIDGVSYSPESIGNTPQGSSWMLTSVDDPTGKTIEFTYQNETIITFGRGGERFGGSIPDPTNMSRRQSFFKQYIQKPVLRKISGELCNIYFKPSSAHREDMPDYLDGSRSLDTIVVTNKNNEEIRSFYFHYGYFTSPSYSTSGILDIGGYDTEAEKRLYLKSVVEKKGTDSLPPYEFTYNETELPSRFSTSQDYWGYYNGKSNGTSIMPQIPGMPFNPLIPLYEDEDFLPGYNSFLNYGGADRRIDTNYSQARILTKIKYPTGGVTEYYYEQNEASTAYLNIHGGMVPPDMVEKSYTFSLLSNPLPAEPPYPLYFTGTFSINIPATQVKITPLLTTCTTYVDASCKLEVKIRSLPDSTLLHTINMNNVFLSQLPMGEYLVEVFVDGSPDDYPPSFQVDFEWGERTDSLSFKVGGVRVKKIISRDSVGNMLSRSFVYKKDSSDESSGILEGLPTYRVHDVNSSGTIFRQYYVSNSALPLTAEGKTVRYDFITEYYDTARSSFKTTYAFTSGIYDPRKFAGGQTGAPLVSWDWQNNLLKRKQVFEKTGEGSYRVLSDEQSFFSAHQPVYDMYGLYGPQIIPYSIATEWHLPDSSVSTTYSYTGAGTTSLQTTTKTLYNDNFLPSVNRTYNSKGQVIESRSWYATDYNDVSGYHIPYLYDKHIWTAPIRQEVVINGKTRSGSITKYNVNGQPTDVYSYENAVLTDAAAHDRDVVPATNYKWKNSLGYDENSNLKQVNSFNSGPATIIWDYEIDGFTGAPMNLLPAAMVQNADSNSVAYTSFEHAATGNWTIAGTAGSDATSVMGSKDYDLSGGNVSRSGLSNTKTYIVSYWKKSGSVSVNSVSPVTGRTINGWTYYEHKVVNPSGGTITVSGTGVIDELRLYPEHALMTSYHSKPLIGLASQCGADNRIAYYEYDGLNRLSLIRDDEKNILKKICYNYAGQPMDCGYGTLAAWQAISSSCEQDEGSNTGNLVVVEKDMNPASSTYGETRNITLANQGSCPVCNPAACTGNDKKCINNLCETGVKVVTGSVRLGSTTWRCYYHYVWSDSSTSETYDEIVEGVFAPCPID